MTACEENLVHETMCYSYIVSPKKHVMKQNKGGFVVLPRSVLPPFHFQSAKDKIEDKIVEPPADTMRLQPTIGLRTKDECAVTPPIPR